MSRSRVVFEAVADESKLFMVSTSASASCKTAATRDGNVQMER
jgi:hypothetical protein